MFIDRPLNNVYKKTQRLGRNIFISNIHKADKPRVMAIGFNKKKWKLSRVS